MDLQLSGKKALVCAASKGIGKAIATALAKEGVNVFICARTEDALIEASKEIKEKAGQSVNYLACNLATPAGRNELYKKVRSTLGSIDILVHNTGGPKPSIVSDTTMEAWEQGYRNLFESVAHLNELFLPGMKSQKWGRILNITSLSVIEPISNLAVSNAMRSAATAMLKTLSDEVAPLNITVNCIAPGVIYTDRTKERIKAQIAQHGGDEESCLKDYVKGIPAGRLGTADELAALAAFLCSPLAAYITGSTICVDGGRRRSTN